MLNLSAALAARGKKEQVVVIAMMILTLQWRCILILSCEDEPRK